jgi:hypothetical protein
MELDYHLTYGATFVARNIAKEPTLIFSISEGFFDENLLSVSIIEENSGQPQI